MIDLWVIAAAGILTYALRASFIAALGPSAAPPLLERMLRQVKPAVLAALVATSVVGGSGGESMLPVLVALAGAGLLATRFGPITVLAGGMVLLWILA